MVGPFVKWTSIDMVDAKEVVTPMSIMEHFLPYDSFFLTDAIEYHCVIGVLEYLRCSILWRHIKENIS